MSHRFMWQLLRSGRTQPGDGSADYGRGDGAGCKARRLNDALAGSKTHNNLWWAASRHHAILPSVIKYCDITLWSFVFNALTTCYLFLGGTGAGACVVLSFLEIMGRCHGCTAQPSRWSLLLPGEFFARAWASCLIVLSVGILCLVVDVGHPDRLLSLFLSPTFSPLSVGAWTLAIVLLVVLLFTIRSVLDNVVLPTGVSVILAVAVIGFGLVACVYTGVLLESLVSVLAFRTILLPLLFLVSSLSCGVALAFIALAFTESRFPYLQPLHSLATIDGVLIGVEAAILLLYLGWLSIAPGTQFAAEAITVGPFAPLFWGGIGVIGLVVPWILERFLTHGNARTQLLWIALCLLVGGLCVRLCVVGLSAYDVTQMPSVFYGLA